MFIIVFFNTNNWNNLGMHNIFLPYQLCMSNKPLEVVRHSDLFRYSCQKKPPITCGKIIVTHSLKWLIVIIEEEKKWKRDFVVCVKI